MELKFDWMVKYNKGNPAFEKESLSCCAPIDEQESLIIQMIQVSYKHMCAFPLADNMMNKSQCLALILSEKKNHLFLLTYLSLSNLFSVGSLQECQGFTEKRVCIFVCVFLVWVPRVSPSILRSAVKKMSRGL